jgi:hypothetical protein
VEAQGGKIKFEIKAYVDDVVFTSENLDMFSQML